MAERLQELTRKELLSDVDGWTKEKATLVREARYAGVTDDYTVLMKVPSVTADPPTTYFVYMNLVDYEDVAGDEDLTTAEKVRLAITGDVKIGCTCPAFLYFGYKYILTNLDTNALDDENRFPKVKNPDLEGVMCKHCYAAMKVVTRNYSLIARDIKGKKFLR